MPTPRSAMLGAAGNIEDFFDRLHGPAVTHNAPGSHKSWRVELVGLAAQPFSQIRRQIVHIGFDRALNSSKDWHNLNPIRTRDLKRLDDSLNGCAGSDGQYIAISQVRQQIICRHSADVIQLRTAALRQRRYNDCILYSKDGLETGFEIKQLLKWGPNGNFNVPCSRPFRSRRLTLAVDKPNRCAISDWVCPSI